ncbi:nucleotide exchange factor GrpE [Microbacterium sp. APC 3898]|uniref:Protein GrpE n=2 Tax=Planococcus TaxID=1372 RepID=A0ABT7ZI91_9BACL|nr:MULTISPECIES: nucleotide exchange factor GrpE [Terrabacteria group]MDN3426864.1 nucleotide exchange factor GrpE [Planococcus sp. APC 4016]MDN3438120.1 nucleotide exchange factor GrpE [Planococcus sp. APC 3900]MDN3499988.1 nucleotide exchange factor GrpE [Microbacterium sp. APC 3898]
MSKKNEPLKTEEQDMAEEVEEKAKAPVAEEETEFADTETPEVDLSAEQEEETVDEAEELRKQLEAEQNKYLRLLADYDNFKRRTQIDKDLANKFRSQSLLSDILPVLDNFERALSLQTTSEESASVMKGVEMVQKSLIEAVSREGLEEIKAVGEPFDPNFHQAVMQEKDDSAEPGTVLQELQKGYILKGRVLRPAMVKVNE